MRKTAGIVLMLIGAAGFAFAGAVPTAPEIDPASALGAFALLSGAMLIVRGRRPKS